MACETNIVKITGRQTVKPCSPTPKHLKTLKISLLDQLAVDMYIPLVLFYPSNDTLPNQQNPYGIASERSEHLRETLSKALVHFYPLAGRLRHNLCVECNDDGVEFFEARATITMPELLQRPDLEVVTQLIPTRPEAKEASLGGSLFLVQVTIFDCGGLALGLSISHKIFDACSMASFVNTWATITRDNYNAIIEKPEFGKGTDLFPPSLELSSSEISGVELTEEKCATRRYVFETDNIAALRSKAASSKGAKNPTRVEAVAGLIWKCVEAWRSSNTQILKNKSVWCHYVNMRTRFVPALAPNVAGNFVGVFSVETKDSECGNFCLEDLVTELRRAIEKVKENYASPDYLSAIRREYEEYVKLLMDGGDRIDIYHFSSWCRFGLYESDFGWEKPVWASLVCSSFKNNIYLMDTRDGDGVEAWFYLTEQDMAAIESNEEFLAHASLNPGI